MRSPHFRVIGNSRASKVEEIALSFERFRDALEVLFPQGAQDAVAPSTVVVFKNDESFTPYKSGRGSKVDHVVGQFQGTPFGNWIQINAFPAQGSALPVVYHEYVHAFLAANGTGFPLWLEEGLAEYYSSFAIERGDLLVGQPIERHVKTMRERTHLPLARLFAVTRGAPEYNEAERAGIFYAQSWLLTHWCLAGGEERLGALRGFLARRNAGEKTAEAFQGAFGVGYAAVESELLGYARGRLFPYQRLVDRQLPPPPALVTRPLERPEVLYELGASLTFRFGSAADLAREHLAEAARGSVADAHALLGFLEQEAGRAEKAAEHFSQAGTADRPLSLFLRARHLVGSGTAPRAMEARALLRRALEVEPALAEAHALLGKTYLWAEGEEDEGIAILEGALSRLGRRADVAYDLAMLRLRRGELAEAERLVEETVIPLGSSELGRSARAALANARAVDSANRAIAGGDAVTTTAALRQALEETDDPALRSQIESMIEQSESHHRQEEQVERFNAAITLANAGRLEEARGQLRDLLEEAPGGEMEIRVRDALGQIERAFAERRD